MRPARRLRASLTLVAMFLWDLLVASLAVARIVLSPRIRTAPAIIRVETELERPWAVALFAYFMSLTPGSTCLHVSEDQRSLYVHVLNTADAATTIARFKRIYERWIMELER
ncbi:multisubunit Na+/H+ antiporter MnhE subunit [Sphingobium sp. B2D3A]|uniref:Na+/H+ antiporter subunit E n=1 Tax=unclassified Sphingobium TaxID=2611147 RepID=UPI002225016E|nr:MULTISPECIES: Na+/H+ antiporter subunit E [unclassified Sphingobium]MCW2335942.1 multisubunit Na+/H+ antiporter MnhE subunit [Sphingobium sp. B2D3A]MCW2385701.1 multisubunit Na+/H+ antiporter MnhE subunit [Sphingobium sp. B2D3D]